MKLLRLSLLGTCLLAASSLSYALMCPNNFNTIKIGDSIEAVSAACGAPSSTKEMPAPDSDPQEWSYFLPSPGKNNMMYTQQTTLKTTVAFDGKGKVVNISTNGVGTDMMDCGSGISVGSTRQEVEQACGKPQMIAKSDANKNAAPDKDNKMIEYYYAGPPAGTLVFIKGVLVDKR